MQSDFAQLTFPMLPSLALLWVRDAPHWTLLGWRVHCRYRPGSRHRGQLVEWHATKAEAEEAVRVHRQAPYSWGSVSVTAVLSLLR
jgi:hypothetical protein